MALSISPKGPMVLIILDGWGVGAPDSEANAIHRASKPTWDRLCRDYPYTTLGASAEAVGLPAEQMGHSEVGHLTIGAGRVLCSDLERVDEAIHSGALQQDPLLSSTFAKTAETKQALHFIGLLSAGGVHSHEKHLLALLESAARFPISQIWIHAFLDGRDTPPKSAESSISALADLCARLSTEHTQLAIGSLCGRYYAMDRDYRFERTQAVYELLTEGKADWSCDSASKALSFGYARGETDEFLRPTIIDPAATIKAGDSLVFFNFRADRIRQLAQALANPEFSGFKRNHHPKTHMLTLTEYDPLLQAAVLFPKIAVSQSLGAYLQDQGLMQLRLAETEKYAHVTFFFNGGIETPFRGEDRMLIPSKKVATYDQCPAMSAVEITDALVTAIHARNHEVIICNYANADMVGHTGNFEATVAAIECLDHCLARVLHAAQGVQAELLITADHGNADCLIDRVSGQAHTAHTMARVPFIYVGRPARVLQNQGSLADVAPTLLHLLHLPIPPAMSGQTIFTLQDF